MFATDAGWLQRAGFECVLFGPGSIEVAHRANELLPVEEFHRAGEVLDRPDPAELRPAMSRVLEPDAGLDRGIDSQPGVQIAIGADGRIEAVGELGRAGAEALPRTSRCCPGSSTPIRTPSSAGSAGRASVSRAGAGSFWTWREAMYALVGSLDRADAPRG